MVQTFAVAPDGTWRFTPWRFRGVGCGVLSVGGFLRRLHPWGVHCANALSGRGGGGGGEFYERPRPPARWAFACAVHVDELTTARGLLDRDRAELARRQHH